MTLKDSTAGAPALAGPGTALLPVLAGAATYLLLLAVGANFLNDPDSYWHLASGKLILASGLPTADPFSFTFQGTPWIAKEWLSQLAFYAVYAAMGWTGMVVLAAGAFAVAIGLLARFLQERLAPLYTIAFVAVAFMLVAPHALARPHILALPILVAWVASLLRANEGARAPSLWLLPLMTLWANLHGGFLMGLVLAGAIGLDALVSAPAFERRRVFLVWLRFGVLALAAACITPYGPGILIAALRVLGVGSALSLIGEWRPADFSHLTPLAVALLGGLGAALVAGVRLPPVRTLTLVGLVYLALSAERNAELLGLVAPMLVAAPLARQFPAISVGGAPAGRAGALPATIVAAVLVALTAVVATIGAYQPNPRVTPAAAVTALKEAGVGPVLNDYDFGGYLIAEGVPTFIDGRTELYGAEFFSRYHRAMLLTDIPALTDILDRTGIGATIFAPTTPVVAFLDTRPEWRRLYADDVAVVHVRAEPSP